MAGRDSTDSSKGVGICSISAIHLSALSLLKITVVATAEIHDTISPAEE
jgi:hypothetical protein